MKLIIVENYNDFLSHVKCFSCKKRVCNDDITKANSFLSLYESIESVRDFFMLSSKGIVRTINLVKKNIT